MQEVFVQIIFGWPFMILSLLLAVAGILMKRPVFLIAGAIFFVPPAWYLSGYPVVDRVSQAQLAVVVGPPDPERPIGRHHPGGVRAIR